MNTTICPTRDSLAEYVLGKVSESDVASIASHVETCPACQATLETLDGLSDTFIARLRGVTSSVEDSDASLLNAVLADIESITSDSRPAARGSLPEPAIPLQVGHYQLVEKLGQGGMGTVYRGFHTKLKRTVAVKLLPADRHRSSHAVARFHREMEAVGRLDHQNIVRAHDAGEADGQFFLAMELIEGINLSLLVRNGGPLPVADACEIIRQAAIGLQHAHEHGLIHRDVKPSNLMLATNGVVKVLDLGLARFEIEQQSDGEATVTGQIVGSPDYMAPEQISDSGGIDARTDVYALGCTLYFLLAGRPPFGDKGCHTILEKIMARANEAITPIRQLRPDVSSQLAILLGGMLAKCPTDRCPTAAEAAQRLTPFCNGSDLARLLTHCNPVAPTTSPHNSSDLASQKCLTTPPVATVPSSASHRMAWLIGAVVVLFVAVALWYGIGALRGRSSSASWFGNENRRNTQLAQLPASAEDSRGGQDERLTGHNAEATSAYLGSAAIPEPVRAAMLTVVRQHPSETRWSGRTGTTLFGIASKRLPKEGIRRRAMPAMLELTHMLAVHELLTAKSLLDRYAATGLTDATTLRQAVVEASGQLQVSGKTSTVTYQTATTGDIAVGYAMADEGALTAKLLQPDELQKVRIAYRDVMHREARELMRRSNWSDALLLWQHLHKRQLVSQQLYLDAAECFKQLGQIPDMLRVLSEAINTFGKQATSEFLEQAGDMALAVETDQGQALAEAAYHMASERLKDTISTGREVQPTEIDRL